MGRDGTEAGAPTIDPIIPYGSSNLVADIKRIAGVRTSEEALALHRETEDGLRSFLEFAHLTPGAYSYLNRIRGRENEFTFDVVPDILPEQANDETVTFEVTDKHLALPAAGPVEPRCHDQQVHRPALPRRCGPS